MSQNANDMNHSLTKMLSDTEIEIIAKTGKAPDTQLFKVPCHSQGEKRCVRIVTEASENVCGLEERHGRLSKGYSIGKTVCNSVS
ncbi:hypothetical protein AVEN_180710-1 [Araneus ventricosus]|uniref:Uncharacterized protein n=1 Tax=Araneus ventricosus TaxID=182803 RepID=A0A4Y2FWI4_ARAVE|nr:hypothetical protein AVEN_180710-1 [Araneus ventricosus]